MNENEINALNKFLQNIRMGTFDKQFDQIKNAMDERRKVRQDEVMKQVREVFGSDAVVKSLSEMPSEPRQDTSSTNPFINKAAKVQVDDANDDQPVQYRNSPVDGNGFRVIEDHGNGFVTVADIFGGYEHSLAKADWESWPVADESKIAKAEQMPKNDDGPMTDALSSTDDANVDMGGDPILSRGAIIGGIGLSDMAN